MATAEKRVVTDATGQAMLAELRKIPGVMNPVPVEKGGTGVTTPEEILELINAEPKLPVDVVEELGLRVKSVNGNLPDEHGDVRILHVSTADNLSSDESTVVNGTFIERTTGGDASIQDGPANLGVLYGYSIRTGYTAENKRMEVIPVGRLDDSIVVSAEINWNTFKTAVNGISTNKTFTYTTAWNENPETYGITVSGTPVSGDVINVYFIAENRGTITNTTPETFVETNWNLYDSDKGYAKVMKYSDEYGFMIGGTYTGIGFSETVGGTQIVLTPDSNGHFQVPSDGYVYVTGGDEANTYILMTWSDWGEGYTGEFLKYEESVVDFSELMENSFPFGLCSIGVVSDEINFNDKTAYIRIERVAYSTENRINAEASGRAFVYDDDWIYQVKETPEKVRFNIDNSMTVFDHGIEFFTGTELPVTVYQLFGQNLKDKLRREVITVTPQNFSVAQKKIARDNIEAAWDPEVIKTINHKYPDQFGDITIVEGTANASYGLYRINAVIQPAAWMLVNGAYQVAYSDPLIKSDMDGMETWLDNPEVMLGKTRFSTIDGALIISTAVLPTETWNLHVALGTNGSTVLEQVYNKAEQNTVGLVENDDTAFHNISAGQYVIWKGVLYKAVADIIAGDTLASTGNTVNLVDVSSGASNDIAGMIMSYQLPNNTDLNDVTTPGTYVVSSSNTHPNNPLTGMGFLTVSRAGFDADGSNGLNICRQVLTTTTGYVRVRGRSSSKNWSAWQNVNTYTSGTITPLSSVTASELRYVKCGRVVHLFFRGLKSTTLSGSSWTKFADLPADIDSEYRQTNIIHDETDNITKELRAYDGELCIYNFEPNHTYYGSITYISKV